MSEWTVQKYNGSIWEADSSIPRPHEDIDDILVSTQQAVLLADGSKASYTPETYSSKQDLVFVWYIRDATFKDQLEDWITAHAYLQITTHLSGIIFEGRFKQVKAKWLTGESPDEFVIEAIFERMA